MNLCYFHTIYMCLRGYPTNETGNISKTINDEFEV